VRIVHVASARERRGGQRQTWLLVRALAALGVDQVVVAGRGTPLARRLEHDGLPFVPVPWRLPLDPRAVPAFLRELRRGPGIVHAHDHDGFLLAAAAPRGGAPLVVTRRSAAPVRRPALWRRADRVVAVSRAVERRLLADGLDRGQIVVIPPGIPLPETRAAKPAGIRAALRLPADAPLALTIGALDRGQGHAALIEAARRLLTISPELHWIVAGEGPRRASLLRLAARLGVADRVHFVGHPDNPISLIADATALVLPGTVEPIGTAVLDAMALGVPVVAGAIGGIPEILGDSAGLLVPPDTPSAVADAVHRLLVEPAFADVVARAAAAQVERYEVGRMAAAHLPVYRSVGNFLDGRRLTSP
jgi:glycosyltransferase involved in cell wall biosynthesis